MKPEEVQCFVEQVARDKAGLKLFLLPVPNHVFFPLVLDASAD